MNHVGDIAVSCPHRHVDGVEHQGLVHRRRCAPAHHLAAEDVDNERNVEVLPAELAPYLSHAIEASIGLPDTGDLYSELVITQLAFRWWPNLAFVMCPGP